MGVMDNTYMLNYLINRQISKIDGRLIATFINLRTTFDNVDRNILWNAMGKRRMKRTLGKRRMNEEGNIQGNDTEAKSQRNHDRTLD
ncbi:hypothetical protein HZH68_013218 [Vespula germanica]|uniref:Reverse transcriptase domain-containing protein n=1 Tax=Vespula germanica TaxID=30212 RepID=A0A834JIH3_VESGE|nr:hypothetical protein HZH68_013218 [Vespula germanica]